MDNILNVNEAKTRLMQELADIIGFKYLKSGILKKTVKDIVFEINFFSSKWNLSGVSIEINADFRIVYKKYANLPSSCYNIVGHTSFHNGAKYWYDISTESKLIEVRNILEKRFGETAVDIAERFEENYEAAIKYLFYEKFDEYGITLDFVADNLGQDVIREKAQQIYDALSDEVKEEVSQYQGGQKTKAWMHNRCNLRYIADNDLFKKNL
jgi:hypothetical protein